MQRRSSVLNLHRLWLILCSHAESILFPRSCACCNISLFCPEDYRPLEKRDGDGRSCGGRPSYKDFLCSRCASSIRLLISPLCSVCGEPFKTPAGPDHICGRCLKNPPGYDTARSIFAYEDTIQTLIHRIKYQAQGYPLKALAQLAKPYVSEIVEGMEQPDLICPVPVHASRLRQRGFNQASALAYEIFDRNAWWICPDILIKNRRTPPQVELSRQERLRNVKGSFGVKDPSLIRRKNVLLFDDVFTTGATVSECARTLKKNGAERVFAVTIARAWIKRDRHPVNLDNS